MKTSELSGAALDWAVATAEGEDYFKLDLYAPSKLWEQGGLIIEQEKIGIWWATHFVDDEGVEYGNHWYAEDKDGYVQTGQTPLTAAMRCYVASKLGDEVQIPDELTMLGG